MSVYTTKELTREEAIRELSFVWKYPHEMTNEELEDNLFNLIGCENLPNPTLNNYRIIDEEV